MEIKNFGSIYLDGIACAPGVKYNNQTISLGDTDPETAIPFVKWRNLWVATECVCFNVSWEDLDKAGFIFGHPIKIDGAAYLCRSLKVGNKKEVPNEWNSILNDLGEKNTLWHWEEQYFWGQETPSSRASYRVVRGYYSARFWDRNYATARNVYIGFRPALEPLPPEPLISEALIGKTIRVCGPGGNVYGRLVDFTDYDLLLQMPEQQIIPHKSCWVSRDGNAIVINREAIILLKEEN